MRYRPGSEDVTGAVAWVSAQSTLVFWFNKNCTSRGSWGRRHRGTRGPARSRTRPGERRSVHKSAKMASRSCFGSFVYTVATREGRASGAAARLASLPRQQPSQTPRSPLWRLGKYPRPIGARFGRFQLVGRLWCVERRARLTKRAVPDDLHDPLAQDVPSPHESEAHYRRDVAEHVELDELPEPPMALGPIPEGYASSPSLRGASRRQRLGSD